MVGCGSRAAPAHAQLIGWVGQQGKTGAKMGEAMTYVIQGYYGSQYGWEDVCAETERGEAVDRLREYRENDPDHGYRMIQQNESEVQQ